MFNSFKVLISQASEDYQTAFSRQDRNILLLLFALLIFGILSVFGYLKYEVDSSDEKIELELIKNRELSEQLNKSEQKNNYLKKQIIKYEDAFSQIMSSKNDEYRLLAKKVRTIEELFYTEEKMGTLSERIISITQNTAFRATMLQLIPSGEPMKYIRISSNFGPRIHPVLGVHRFHNGIDLTARIGEPIYSAADGIIETKRKNPNKGYGNMVKIRHGFGFTTLYAHLDRINANSGQFVKKGELIGWSGNTGLSTGPHLHYEIRFLEKALNPIHFMNWSLDSFDGIFKHEKHIKWQELIEVIENKLKQARSHHTS